MASTRRFNSMSSQMSTPFHGRNLTASTPLLSYQNDVTFSNDVADWLTSLGFKKEIDKNLLKRLCPKAHRNMWYHLMKHVRPCQEVSLAKKNVLISNLEKDKKKYKEPLKAIVNTPEDFENYKKWIDFRNEIGLIESEVQTITGEIRTLQLKARFTEHQIKVTKQHINESNHKNDLLIMKIKQEKANLQNLEDRVNNCELLINKAYTLEKNESSTDKISAFLTDLENLHSSRQIDKSELVTNENDLVWDKASELLMTVPATDIIKYVKSNCASISEKLNEELTKFTTLKASVLKAGTNDFSYLQQSLCDTFTECLEIEKETEKIKENIDQLKLQIADNVIKKFSLRSDAHESIMVYLDSKCAQTFNEQKVESYKKVASDLNDSDNVLCLEKLSKLLTDRVDHMDACIKDKISILSESIDLLLNDEGSRKIEQVREEIMKIVSEFSSSVESADNCNLLEMKGMLKDEVTLFLQVPLQKNRLDEGPPLPSWVKHFSLNRQKHLLPLQILAQRSQMTEIEKLMSTTSEAHLINQLTDQNSEKKKLPLTTMKEMKESNEAHLKKRLMSAVIIFQETEIDLLRAAKCAELLDKEKTLNNLLLKRDPSRVEEFIKYEEIMRKSLAVLNEFISKK